MQGARQRCKTKVQDSGAGEVQGAANRVERETAGSTQGTQLRRGLITPGVPVVPSPCFHVTSFLPEEGESSTFSGTALSIKAIPCSSM